MSKGHSNLSHAIAGAIVLVVVVIAQAKAADLVVTDAWIRALPSSVPSGGYFTLHNRGPKPATLSGASSSACGMLMLHKSNDAGGMTSMADVSTVEVPAGGTINFAPGGYHLMCMDAKPEVKPGAEILVRLRLNDGSSVSAKFAVRNAAGK